MARARGKLPFLPSRHRLRLFEKGNPIIFSIEQQKAVADGAAVALNVGGTECVVVRRDIYLRLDPDYDTGPWTTEERNLLADEAEEMISQTVGRRHAENR